MSTTYTAITDEQAAKLTKKQIAKLMQTVINSELETNIEMFFLTMPTPERHARFSIAGSESDCEKAVEYLVQTQAAIIEYEDRYSDPDDPDFRVWRIAF